MGHHHQNHIEHSVEFEHSTTDYSKSHEPIPFPDASHYAVTSLDENHQINNRRFTDPQVRRKKRVNIFIIMRMHSLRITERMVIIIINNMRELYWVFHSNECFCVYLLLILCFLRFYCINYFVFLGYSLADFLC